MIGGHSFCKSHITLPKLSCQFEHFLNSNNQTLLFISFIFTNMNDQQRDPDIVFFDGVCNLCNGFIDFLIKRDKKHVLKYASLQGNEVKEILSEIHSEQLNTIIYLRNGKVYYQSKAVLLILKDLRGIWSMAYGLIIFPRFFRDWVYNVVARNRYQWFGKRDTCRLPTEDEKKYILE